MKDKLNFNLLINIRNKILNPQENLSEIKGTIIINKDSSDIINNFEIFNKISDNLSTDNEYIYILHIDDLDIDNLPDSDKPFNISIIKKGIKKYFDITYYDSLDFFLNENMIKHPDNNFYIHSESFLFSENKDDTSNFYNYYLSNISLIKMFIDISDDKQQISNKDFKILFIIDSNLKKWIKIDCKSLLNNKDLLKLEELNKMLNNESYKLELGLIIKSNIVSFSNQHHTNKLEPFILNFQEFYTNIKRDYQIFISKLSFNNIYKDFEKQKNEHIKNLDDQIKNISKEILSIPIVAGISILLQFLKQNELIYSLIFFMSFLIYSLIQIIIICNNLKYLKYLMDKVKKDEKDFTEKKVYEYFENDFSIIKSKSKIISSSSISVIILFVIINLVLLFFTILKMDIINIIKKIIS